MKVECHASYLRDAFQNTDVVIERIAEALEGKDYDTIVGSGVSGAILLLKLRDRFKCNVAVVRKKNDGSHSNEFVEGTIGERFVIVDDQVASGDTVKHILRQIRKQLIDREFVSELPKFVGVACYCYRGLGCGIEKWIDASDSRFTLPELPVEKPRAAFAMPPQKVLLKYNRLAVEDTYMASISPGEQELKAIESIMKLGMPREFWRNELTPESSRTPEQIPQDIANTLKTTASATAWQAYYGSLQPIPRSPIIGDTST